jgi:Glycoside Hydrolase Family 113
MKRCLTRLVAPLVLVSAVTGSLVTACSHPLIPTSVLSPQPDPSPARTHSAPMFSDVRPSRPFLGVDLYALHNYPAATVSLYGQRMIPYIKDVLHADAVGIVWNFYATTYTSDKVIASPSDTLSASNVAILTRLAKAYHLKVEYRPLIMVTGEKNPWQGLITPTSQLAWFRSYYRAELPYLRVGQRLRIKEFVAANEMHRLNGSPVWPRFFAWERNVFHGVESYTAWDEDYLPKAQHVLPVRYLGTNMYRPLFLRNSATSAQVAAAWEAYFAQVPASVLMRTAIDETGIAARAGAYRHPGDMWANVHRDEQVQVNWFLAACRTVMRYHLRGVFIWKVDLADNPAFPAQSLSTFEGQKGAVAINECARILHPRSAG